MRIKKIPEFKSIYCLDVFEKELEKQFGKSEAQYHKYLLELYSYLRFLDDATFPPETGAFERIVYKGIPFYRIKSKSKAKNIRTLYFWYDSGHILLLTAFQEKNSSDYENAKQVAHQRYKTLGFTGGFEDE